jgi:hypothetical protein
MSTPAHKLRDGALQVVVWRNTSTGGSTYYTATPQRSYKQGDDTWRETDSLNGDDLLTMAELLREAYAWIRMQKRSDVKGIKERDKVTAR